MFCEYALLQNRGLWLYRSGGTRIHQTGMLADETFNTRKCRLLHLHMWSRLVNEVWQRVLHLKCDYFPKEWLGEHNRKPPIADGTRCDACSLMLVSKTFTSNPSPQTDPQSALSPRPARKHANAKVSYYAQHTP